MFSTQIFDQMYGTDFRQLQAMSIHCNAVLDWVALECGLSQSWDGPYHDPFHAMLWHSTQGCRGPVADWVARAHSTLPVLHGAHSTLPVLHGAHSTLPVLHGAQRHEGRWRMCTPRLGITMCSRLQPAGGPYCVLDHQFRRWGLGILPYEGLGVGEGGLALRC